MSKKNFIARQMALQDAYFEAGLQMGRQQIIDMMCLTLNDPKIMKKDTFGRDRLMIVIGGIGKKIDTYQKAFEKSDEADYYQAKLDQALADAFREKKIKDSFYQRYEFLQKFDYKDGKWK